MTDIISFGVQLYPKTVKITKGTGIASFLPDNDPSKAFDVTDDVMATVVEALANAYPADQLVPTKIVAGQSIRGVDGTGSDGTDPFLLPENLKPGITIEGVVSDMPTVDDTAGADGDLEITIPEGYSDGTKTTTASDTALIAENIKPGVTIFGVVSTMQEGTDIVDAQAVTPIIIPAGYYDGTQTIHS